MSDLPFFIRSMQADDLSELQAFAQGHEDHPDYFVISLDEQLQAKRFVFIAFQDGRIAGYAHLNRFPQYQPFRSLGLAEIQDLYVGSVFRCNGIGQKLVEACEAQAKSEGMDMIGIGVGVGGNFGAAQRLYARMGYVPDGAGVVFDRQSVSVGEVRAVDDRLCLMLVKSL
ncbi:MAG: GNAT family N-acetyltransferase [Pseudobdellovibrionaceae bacterium]|jgi:GNAT superfamily N-acetyltransferase|nr:GNAT family N-acetyltransferase [Pseudobdellovibrionaceae bacterium]